MTSGGDWQTTPSGPEDAAAEASSASPLAPQSSVPSAAAPAPVVTANRPPDGSRYPIDLGVDTPDRIARWRPLVQGILALPLWVALYFLRIAMVILATIGWFAALFTGQLPEGLGNFIAGYYRYYWRTVSYGWFLRESYPPFFFDQGYEDPRTDPAWFEVRRGERLNRLAVFFRLILVIPQVIVLFFLLIALSVVVAVGFFAVIILGRWPQGMRDFVVGATRWGLRVDAWFYLLADPYPPFSLN